MEFGRADLVFHGEAVTSWPTENVAKLKQVYIVLHTNVSDSTLSTFPMTAMCYTEGISPKIYATYSLNLFLEEKVIFLK